MPNVFSLDYETLPISLDYETLPISLDYETLPLPLVSLLLDFLMLPVMHTTRWSSRQFDETLSDSYIEMILLTWSHSYSTPMLIMSTQ
jgi:hypothetical protein